MSFSPGPIDHLIPLPLGGDIDQEIDERAELLIVPVDESRLFVSRVPGFPPYPHYPLQPPEFYHLLIPQIAAEEQDADMVDWRRPLGRPDSGMARALDRASQPSEKAVLSVDGLNGIRLDPLFAAMIYLAVGLGTITISVTTRYAILWLVLMVGGLLLTVFEREREPVRVMDVVWGGGLGFVFSIPFLMLNWEGLINTSILLYPFEHWETTMLALLIAAPLAENLFFRGRLLEERGIWVSLLAVLISSVIFYWPAVYHHPLNFAVSVILATVFAAIYTFLRRSISMSAAIACQVMLNGMIFLLPSFFA